MLIQHSLIARCWKCHNPFESEELLFMTADEEGFVVVLHDRCKTDIVPPSPPPAKQENKGRRWWLR